MTINPVSAANLNPAGTSAPQTGNKVDGAMVDGNGGTHNTPDASKAAVDPQALKTSVETINNYLKSFHNNSIEFSIDTASSKVIVQLVDTQTQTVLMQTPSKEALAIAQALDKTQGLLIQTKA